MKNRLASFFRLNAMPIAIVIMVVSFGSILFLQAVATNKLQEQTRQQTQIISQIQGVTEQLNKGAAQRTEQIASINRHLDCIVQFFAADDRANKTIADINTCTLQNTKDGSTTSLPTTTPTSPAPVATTPTTTAPSSTSPAATPAPQASQPSFLDNLTAPIKSVINWL